MTHPEIASRDVIVLVTAGGAFFSKHPRPYAVAPTPVGPGEVGIVLLINTLFVVIAQLPDPDPTHPRTRRDQRAVRHRSARGPARDADALGAHRTAVLAGVAVIIPVAECAQFIVLGPIVADLAPPHLLGRYLSLYGLSFSAGVALGHRGRRSVARTSPKASGGATPWRQH